MPCYVHVYLLTAATTVALTGSLSRADVLSQVANSLSANQANTFISEKMPWFGPLVRAE